MKNLWEAKYSDVNKTEALKFKKQNGTVYFRFFTNKVKVKIPRFGWVRFS